MLRAFVLSALLASGSALACDMSAAADAVAAATGEIPASATAATLAVSGMDCGTCALELRTALEAVDGVQVALVFAATDEVKVAFDPAKTSLRTITAAIEASGKYRVQT